MTEELLTTRAPSQQPGETWFGGEARETAVRLLAWCHHRPSDAAVDGAVEELMKARRNGHWSTTQGNAWALFALREYATRVEKNHQPASGTLHWGAQSDPFQLEGAATSFERSYALAPAMAFTPLSLVTPPGQVLYTRVKLESRPLHVPSARQDRGYLLHRAYEKLDDQGTPRELTDLRVGDRVLVTLRFEARQSAHYVAIDDPLPALFEAINPDFKSQQTQGRQAVVEDWVSDFRELRTDRALFFRNHLPPGRHTIRYLARVRAAGTATAPAAKVEEMYHPERFGLSETLQVSSRSLE